jgi:hypothetical protein
VNGIKCELAQTFHDRPYLKTMVREDDGGADIAGSLVLSNVVVNQVSATGGAQIPLAVAIGPSIGAGRTSTSSQSFEIKFTYNVDSGDPVPNYCSIPSKDVAVVEGDPFTDMLNALLLEYNKVEAAKPQIRLGSIGYTGKFEVKEESTGGLKLQFLFLTLGSTTTHAETNGNALNLLFNFKLDPRLMIEVQ